MRYRRGEWEKAVEAQKKAVELEPSSASSAGSWTFSSRSLKAESPKARLGVANGGAGNILLAR